MISLRESVVENYFKDQVTAYGGLAMKFVSPSLRGVPDQIVLYKGKTYYAEIKAPGKKPRPSQIAMSKRFNQYGITIHVIDTKKGVDDFIKNILKAKKRNNKSKKRLENHPDPFGLNI